MSGQPTGTITFLFTDVEGSTQLWEHHLDWMERAHQRHEALLRTAIAAHGGWAYKQIGDAFQAAFQSAPAALAAAVAAQQALTAEAWGAPGPLRVRIALHTGTTEERADDYVGPLLNRVARLLSAGHGGQILLTAATYALVRDVLPAGVALRDLGERRLKDLIHLEHVYQVVAEGLPGELPPLKTLDARPNNLPAQPNVFIGREVQVAEVLALLRRPDLRLLTLTGPGGTGKTRLALQVAADLLDDFADGVFFVALAALTDSALVPAGIAQVLGVKEEGGTPILERLQRWLTTKRLLLLLDNCEQVLAAGTDVAALLEAAPLVTALVTSRVPLQLYGEKEYLVPPLDLPDRQRPPPPDQLVQYAAVRLFIERARDVRTDFTVTNANAPAVAEICARLDGLPLAIELAAARVRIFPPEALLTRLERRLTLTGGGRDRAARQQTLRGTLDWSYNLLNAGEQQLFQRLAVFQGGQTLEALEAVCNAEGELGGGGVAGVEELVRHSLVQARVGGDGEPRFWMLETIHEYAREKLAASGEEAQFRTRHLDYFLALAESAAPQLTGQEEQAWFDCLEEEHANLRAALDWAREQAGGAAAVGLALRLAAALEPFWEMRGHWSEGRAQLAAAVATGRAGAAGRAGRAALARALAGAARLAWRQGDSAAGRALGEESATLGRAVGDQATVASALNSLGNLAATQGNYAEAGVLYEESLALKRALGDRRGIAVSLANLGLNAVAQGNYAETRVLYEESLALSRALDDAWGIAGSLGNLGDMAFMQGNYAEAGVLFEETLALYRAVGEQSGIAEYLGNLGNVAALQGDYSRAQALLEESLALVRALGDQPGIATTLSGLGLLAALQGDYSRARELLEESLALARAQGHQLGIAWALKGLGNVAYMQTDYAGARARHEESLALSRAVGDRRGIAASLAGLAAVLAGVAGREDAVALGRAVRVLGAVTAVLEGIGGALAPDDRLSYDRVVVDLRAALGAAAFAEAWAAGQALSLDEAVAEALGETGG